MAINKQGVQLDVIWGVVDLQYHDYEFIVGTEKRLYFKFIVSGESLEPGQIL